MRNLTEWRSASADLLTMQSHPVAVLWRGSSSPAKLAHRHAPATVTPYTFMQILLHPRLMSVIAWAPIEGEIGQGKGVCQTGGRVATLSAKRNSPADRSVELFDASNSVLMPDPGCVESEGACMSGCRCKCKPKTCLSDGRRCSKAAVHLRGWASFHVHYSSSARTAREAWHAAAAGRPLSSWCHLLGVPQRQTGNNTGGRITCSTCGDPSHLQAAGIARRPLGCASALPQWPAFLAGE